MSKQRADQLLVDRALAESRTRAQALILAADFQRGVRAKQFAGFGDPPLAGKHLARHDQRLGAGAAFGQAALHQ
jgi:hypothetical protein